MRRASRSTPSAPRSVKSRITYYRQSGVGRAAWLAGLSPMAPRRGLWAGKAGRCVILRWDPGDPAQCYLGLLIRGPVCRRYFKRAKSTHHRLISFSRGRTAVSMTFRQGISHCGGCLLRLLAAIVTTRGVLV
ncbi:hypothetical protein J3E68DRAFT_390861 [Trichoderma sp. SZMC 28012]